MNSGYLSLLLICIAVILLASGWKEVFLSRVPHKEILLFFVFWMLAMQVTLNWGHFSVNGTFLIATLLGISIAIRTRDALRGTHIAVTGLLLASVNVLMQEFFAIDPLFVVYRSEIDIAMWLSLLCLLMRRKQLDQIAGLSIGLALGDLLYLYFHRESVPLYLGSPAFQDKWWLGIVTVRVASVSLQYVAAGFRKVAERLHMPRRGGWRG
jgi:hypothetical protein